MGIEGDLIANFMYADNGLRMLISGQHLPDERDWDLDDRVYGLGVHWYLT
eukprot:CAMPEP_0170494388 /NCGR_PEP_ID=MMETSP0208-20121228/14616_1 /TAXON_ID=197538 /ORGANISM="Strombidium inclinatum, Strain S3" /LENGTH=49 /DNA_ID=CAMNT_0010770441 /DNA_START=391 /DNA_END=540 /DNA_ORIENTATION=+